MTRIESQVRSGAPLAAAIKDNCLGTLSSGAFALIRPHLAEFNAGEGQVFWDSDYYPNTLFPTSGLVSINVRFKSGESIEVATIGREGAAAQFGPEPAYTVTQACTFISGHFFRIPTAQLLAAAKFNAEIANLIQYCREWIVTQSQQIAACNAVHSAEQRLARWLVHSCQRSGEQTFHATQDGIASALGIRRTTVTLLAQDLQAKGLIQYRRGKMLVVDTARLQESACECCATLGKEHWPSIRLQRHQTT